MSPASTLPIQLAGDPPVFTQMKTDWQGRPVAGNPSFRVVIGADRIEFLFATRREPYSAPGSVPGAFHEGLWEYDCAELYLVNPENRHYLELNLAPNGAWWSCFFDEIRVQADIENQALPNVLAEGLEGVSHWEARLIVPIESLPSALEFSRQRTHANVAACLGSEPRQTFVSWATLPGQRPDYHQPAAFLPMRRVPSRK